MARFREEGFGSPDTAAAEALAQELLNQGIPLDMIPQQLVQAGLVRDYTVGQEVLSTVSERRAEAAALSQEVFGGERSGYAVTNVVHEPGGRTDRVTIGVEVEGLGRPYYGTIDVPSDDEAKRREMLERYAQELEADYAEHYPIGE